MSWEGISSRSYLPMTSSAPQFTLVSKLLSPQNQIKRDRVRICNHYILPMTERNYALRMFVTSLVIYSPTVSLKVKFPPVIDETKICSNEISQNIDVAVQKRKLHS